MINKIVNNDFFSFFVNVVIGSIVAAAFILTRNMFVFFGGLAICSIALIKIDAYLHPVYMNDEIPSTEKSMRDYVWWF